MADQREFKKKFWKALKADMTVMLGLEGAPGAHVVPMTAQLDGEYGPIWFFASTENALVQSLEGGEQAFATFASKGHDVFATIHGKLRVDNNRRVIDKLWNRFVAAWYTGGKDDPKLALLRFDVDRAEIWSDASSLIAGIKTLIGFDPKEDFKDEVAEVRLR